MLSRELKNLSRWFGEVMDGRAEFTAEGARALYPRNVPLQFPIDRGDAA